MTDIVERLRDGGICQGEPCRIKETASGCDCAEAADEIEWLRANLLVMAQRLDTWKDRYETEHNAHLATISECGRVLAEAGLNRT